MDFFKKRKFLSFMEKRTNPLTTEINVTNFMITNFKRPDPLSSTTTNKRDKGVLFLRSLKERRLIDYNDATLYQVINWYEDNPPTIKKWFDTLHVPLYVTLTDFYYSDYKPLSLRLSNNKFVLYIKKYTIHTILKIWKAFLAISTIFITAYLGSGSHFDDLIKLIKTWFR